MVFPTDENVIVGLDRADDAGVYKISDDLALIQTVDFFTPIVDDPYWFGQIAAANALSDVYAMGGTPKTAMNLVAFPIKQMDIAVLRQIIQGGLDKLTEAGVVLIGGHSIEDKELKYGLSITGVVHPEREVRVIERTTEIVNKNKETEQLAHYLKTELSNTELNLSEMTKLSFHLRDIKKECAEILHNEIGVELSAAKNKSELDELDGIQTDRSYFMSVIDKSYKKVREVSHILSGMVSTNDNLALLEKQIRDVTLKLENLAKSNITLTERLQNLCEIWGCETLFCVELKYDKNKSFNLNWDKQQKLVHITGELINNARKHGNATKVKISIEHTDNNHIELKVMNNGSALPKEIESHSNGFGLANIKENIKSMNGKFIIPELISGVEFIIQIPT